MKLDTVLILFYLAIPSNSISKIRTEAGGITNVPISCPGTPDSPYPKLYGI